VVVRKVKAVVKMISEGAGTTVVVVVAVAAPIAGVRSASVVTAGRSARIRGSVIGQALEGEVVRILDGEAVRRKRKRIRQRTKRRTETVIATRGEIKRRIAEIEMRVTNLMILIMKHGTERIEKIEIKIVIGTTGAKARKTRMRSMIRGKATKTRIVAVAVIDPGRQHRGILLIEEIKRLHDIHQTPLQKGLMTLMTKSIMELVVEAVR